ncbi:hypothetical protein ACM64Y_06290 [Novispirillum sp. DQ9]|uniref:hypothetical protein n=1 Tax=Novispirillum sp. DQ9 TaxID=3398612 RepID=UPI003C7D106B
MTGLTSHIRPSAPRPAPPGFAEAGARVDALRGCISACTVRSRCPLAAPVEKEIAPAIAAAAAEPLWRATLEHAHTALGCQRHCPAVDMLRAVLAVTRRAYCAAG